MSSQNVEPLQRFRASDFSQRELRDRSQTISVCIPVRNEAATIGPIVDALVSMRSAGLLDQIVVVDASSGDGSAAIAADRGADVFDQSSLMAGYGPVKGKGDAIWRSLAVLTGEIVCCFDGDLTSFGTEYVVGLVGALVANSGVSFVKAAFSRPFRNRDGKTAGEGGRVTEAMARPMLELFYPALCGFRQPLSGQFSMSRKLLESLPISTGYGIDAGLLIDVFDAVGLSGMAEVDIGTLYNAHQTLEDLEPMSYQVGLAITQRLEADGRLAYAECGAYSLWNDVTGQTQEVDLTVETRPPFSSVSTQAS